MAQKHKNSISLNGKWQFKTDPEGLGDFQEPSGSLESWQRTVKFFDLEFDSSAWDDIKVPAN